MNPPNDRTDTLRIARAEGVVGAEIDGEMVVLNVESGQFLRLNGMGSTIWNLVETPLSLAGIAAALESRFEITTEECRGDVDEFVQAMRAKGLFIVA